MIKQVEIPREWTWKKLSDISNIIGGFARPKDEKSYENGSIPFVRMRDLGLHHLTTNLSKTESLLNEDFVKNNKLRIVKKGSILLPRSGSVALNHRAVLGVDACIVSHICALELRDPGVLNFYLYYVLRQIDMKKYSKKTTGLDLITFQDLGKIKVPIPPLEMQKTICTLLGKTERLQQWRRESDKLTNDYLNSVFLNMFGDPLSNNRFKQHKISDLTSLVSYGFTRPMPHFQEGIPIITSKNITPGEIDFNLVDYTDKKSFSTLSKKDRPLNGDVLYKKDGAKLGDAAAVRTDKVFCISQAVAILRTKRDMVNPLFFESVLNTEEFRRLIFDMAYGVAMPHISISKLKKISIICPPLELQNSFVEIKNRISEIRESQQKLRAELKDLDHLLIEKSFGGR